MCAGLSLVVMCVGVGGVGLCDAYAPEMGGCMGFASFFFFSLPFFAFISCFFRLKHRRQPTLTMSLAKPLPSLSFPIVFLFAQRLAARMLHTARSGHGHGGVSAYGIGRAVHAGAHTVHHAFATDVGARSGLREGDFAGLLNGVDPFLGAVLASCWI